MQFEREGSTGPRRVKVRDRDDIGEVIDEGKNLGAGRAHVYCVAVHFPNTGEVRFYDKSTVTTV